jgi:hypothetical protein
MDWDSLLDSSRVHGIRPQLEKLLTRVPAGLVPETVFENLSEAIRENLLRQMRSLSAFYQMKESFDIKGIAVIPYKGPWLAQQYYGNIAEREAYDLDLFIDINDLEEIKRIMTTLGYENRGLINRLTDDYIKNELCEYNFEKYDGETRTHHFEFHWSSSRRPFRMRISLDELRDQITTSIINDKQTQVFSHTAELLLVIMHHGGKEQYAFLKQVNDIAHIIADENEIDWPWLLEKLRQYHLETVLCIGIRQANILTGVTIPEIIKAKAMSPSITRMAKRRIRMTAYPVSKRESFGYILREWLFHIRSRDGVELKLQLAWYTFRKVLLPGVVPKEWHFLFYNKKIRKRAVGSK